MEQQKTYLELISQEEKDVKKELLTIKAKESSLELDKDILEISVKISGLKSEIEKAKRTIPYSVRAEFELQKKLNRLEEAYEFAKEVKEVRFANVNL